MSAVIGLIRSAVDVQTSAIQTCSYNPPVAANQVAILLSGGDVACCERIVRYVHYFEPTHISSN
jgi:hypothetical protein